MIEELLDNTKDELKRADHLIYVSLKYTRTVDVMKSAVERMIAAFDFGFLGLLEKIKKKKKSLVIANQPRVRAEQLKTEFPNDKKIHDFVDFYLLLRELSMAKYDKREEYRRHVTMIAHIGKGEPYELNIDILYEYYEKCKQFIEYLEEHLK